MNRKICFTLCQFPTTTMAVLFVAFYVTSLAIAKCEEDPSTTEFLTDVTTEEYDEITTTESEFVTESSRNVRKLNKVEVPIILPNNVEETIESDDGGDIELFFEVIKIRKRPSDVNNNNTIERNDIVKELLRIRNESNAQEEKEIEIKPLEATTSLIIEETAKSTLEELKVTTENVTIEFMGEPAALVGTLPPPGRKKIHLADPLHFPIHGCPKHCEASQNSIGSCISSEECYKRGGTASRPCCGSFLVCCRFAQYCGDTSSEKLVNFQSTDYPLTSTGSMACDFDLLIQQDVCAVRIDFVQARFFGKIGGICDVDQVLILNSIDGPTSAQCGELSGYGTTVAVRPGQEKPLKIVIIAQNEGYYLWDIRMQQIHCTELSYFKKPPVCGSKSNQETSMSFYQLLDIWRNSAWHTRSQYTDDIWWRESRPAFNRFAFGSRRKSIFGEPSLPDFAEDRIIGGSEADLHEFPWQVAIVLKRVFFCGGALINDEFVLSAAHCYLTEDTKVSDLVVFLGDHDLTSANDTINDIRGVKQVHYHAHFHTLLLSNDLAMLQLDRPVAFSQRIRPICLPDASLAVLGLTGIVAGWGITSYPHGKPNAVLQKLDVQIMSNEFCESALSEDLGAGNLCAVPRGQKGTCFGDSGGPLTIHHNGRETLIGIVSFGIAGCAVTPGLPDLYTRVSEYLQWIDISALKYLE